MKRGALLLAGCFLVVSLVGAASEEVWLLPAKPGKKSEVIKSQELILQIGDKPTVDMEILHFDSTGSTGWLSGNWSKPETICTAFESPAACSVLSIRLCLATVPTYYTNPKPCKVFFALGDAGLDYTADWDDYHTPGCQPGPAPFPTGIYQSKDTLIDTGRVVHWYVMDITNPADVGMTPFIGGYIKASGDSSPNFLVEPGSDATPVEAVHSLIWRPDPASATPGWYRNWHHNWAVAKVRMYSNPPPGFELTRKYDTYVTTQRKVTAHATDFGIPLDSTGVASVFLCYGKNDTTMPDTIAMTLESGDSTDGIWTANLPAASVGDTVTYAGGCADYQGLLVTGGPFKYVIRKGNPGNALVILSRSEYYGSPPPRSPNPWANISATYPVDFWYEKKYGPVDSSVLYFYKDGPGKRCIFVHTFGADPIRSDSAFFMAFLNGGGRLAISSQDMIGDWAGSYDTTTWTAGTFCYDYLKVRKAHDDYHPTATGDTAFIQYGFTGDPISGADNLAEIKVAPYIWHPSASYNYAGIFIDIDPACQSCFVDPDGKIQGYWYQDAGTGYRVVNIYWPFQYIWESGSRDTMPNVVYNVEAQDTLAARLYGWFGIEETPAIPVNYLLSEALPNPGPKSNITYSVPKVGRVSLKVYDISGSLVRTLVNTEAKPGTYTVTWDGHNDYGKLVPAGIYYYRLESGDFSKVRKFVLVR